jgi:hypothetical protein
VPRIVDDDSEVEAALEERERLLDAHGVGDEQWWACDGAGRDGGGCRQGKRS